jgi:hypothetical protein
MTDLSEYAGVYTAEEFEDMISSTDDDSEIAELSTEDEEKARDLRDSKRWYSERSGWSLAEEQVAEELEELCGTSDLAELDRLLSTDDEYAELSDRQRAIAECEERIEWYEQHNYGSIIDDEYAKLKRLKEGGEP